MILTLDVGNNRPRPLTVVPSTLRRMLCGYCVLVHELPLWRC